MAALTPEAQKIFGATYDPPEELWLKVHFTESEASQAAGRSFLERIQARADDRDVPVSEATVAAHLNAAHEWGATAPAGTTAPASRSRSVMT